MGKAESKGMWGEKVMVLMFLNAFYTKGEEADNQSVDALSAANCSGFGHKAIFYR